MNASVASESTRLARRLGFAALLLYGIGDILGAGIYALVGKVVGVAGDAAWISFLLSGALAAVTGLTYAEFVARVPRSAGAAAYCARAYGGTFVPFLVGLLVLASGLTSAATVSLVLHGYLSVLFPNVPPLPAALAFIALIAFLASWGIRESVGTNNALTCLEAATFGGMDAGFGRRRAGVLRLPGL
jgi:basic amino acid/polyamine antiporter, APA family